MTEENSEGSFDKVKDGFKKVVGGSAEVIEGTAQGVKEAVEDTKEGVEDAGQDVEITAERATGSDIHTGNEDAANRQYSKSGGKEPMNPEDIASHEPTAVKRDKKQGTSGDTV